MLTARYGVGMTEPLFDEIVLIRRTMTWDRDQVGEDAIIQKFEFARTAQMRRVVKQIGQLNDACLEPDVMCWGPMTREEADDYFNDPDCMMYEEWGNKSMNILMYNSDGDWENY
jgi:hypothetical protein